MNRLSAGFAGTAVLTAFMPGGFLTSVAAVVAACVLVICDDYGRHP